MSRGVEGGFHIPESIVSRFRPLYERGHERAANIRVDLNGAAIGAVALPAIVLGISALRGAFSDLSPSEVAPLIRPGILQLGIGAVVGSMVTRRFQRR